MKLSSNNHLIQVYRWFKRRQRAIDFRPGIAIKEHDETRSNGAQAKICPIARMALLWGPFLILPFWIGRFILFPIGIGVFAYTVFGGFGMMALAELGFMEVPTTFFGFVSGAFLGLISMAVFILVLLLLMGVIFKGFELAGDGLRSLQKEQTKKAESEVRATPVIGAWLKSLHDKFCPTATIVVEAEA